MSMANHLSPPTFLVIKYPVPGTPVSGTVVLEDVERETIVKTLEAVRGNKSEAALRLGITCRTLHLKLKKYGMM